MLQTVLNQIPNMMDADVCEQIRVLKVIVMWQNMSADDVKAALVKVRSGTGAITTALKLVGVKLLQAPAVMLTQAEQTSHNQKPSPRTCTDTTVMWLR